MSDTIIPYGAGVIAALLIAYNEGWAWLGWVGMIGALVLTVVWWTAPAMGFCGHALTRALVRRHEDRHIKLLDAYGVGATGVRVWKGKWGWQGITYPRRIGRWHRLGKVEQAAVYMAGAMGSEGNLGASSDLANVDARCSRSAARREARKHL